MSIDSSDCFLCNHNQQSFQTLVPHSLYNKYSSSQNFYYTRDIDSIVHEQISTPYVQFHQYNYLDDDEQYLKRQYALEQFDKKITMLSQYYKFHRDLPVWNERSVDILMERYYTKLKDVDYKKIKQVLKQEQNISLSTHKSFSSFDDSSEITKRSRYSTMLNDLNQTKNESIVLMELCDKIGRALKKVKGQPVIKGNFISNERKFEDFMKKQSKKKETYFKKAGGKRNSLGFKKVKFNPKLNTKDDELLGLRQINFVSNHSVKSRRLNIKQIQKTTANETISREQKVKTKRQKPHLQPHSGRSSISLKKRTPNSQSCRVLKTKNLIAAIEGNQNLKTINEIYKPNQNNVLGRKESNKVISRIRNRSNSHHNLPTTSSRNRQNINKNQARLTRVNSQKFPKSVAKQSIIELEKTNSIERYSNNNQKNLPVQKISRSNSMKRMGSNKKIEPGKNKGSEFLTQKKNSVIENMLEKKLSVFKKKQPIL